MLKNKGVGIINYFVKLASDLRIILFGTIFLSLLIMVLGIIISLL
jgi:hypothetical protein